MQFDTYTLSRLQFALTIMFHYLFPPLSIGLGVLMAIMEGIYLRTRNPQYHAMTQFWVRIFAVNFAVGVATGIVMEFQFGTNWSRYSRFVGDVFGSALAAEGIFAFFLESGFLAVLVFGWDRVSPRMHFFATCMVALGSMFSAVWIVIANSFMQTPAGYRIVMTETGPRAVVEDFWAVVFSPSSVERLVHVVLGAWILGAFFVMSISAWYLLKRRHEDFARKSFTLALWFGSGALIAIWISGDSQARKVAFTQPAKLAALEGDMHAAEGGTGLTLFGVPNEKEEKIEYRIAIPGLLSFLVYGDFDKPVQALDQFPPEDRPPVAIPFCSYHLMLGVASILPLLVGYALWQWWRGRLFGQRWLLWCFVFAVIGPYLANQSGWVCAEVGRQPWIVYGQLRTSDAFSPSVPAGQVGASLLMFAVIYGLLFAVWVYVLNSKIKHGPEPVAGPPEMTTAEGLLDAAARRGSSAPYSMTEAKSGARE
jgi:cytochrome d ubiquinol oxidase subunit I